MLTLSLSHLNKASTFIGTFSLLVNIIFSVIFIHEIAPCSIFLTSFLLCLTIIFILYIFSQRHLNGLVWHFQSSFFFLPKTEFELKIGDLKKQRGLHKPQILHLLPNPSKQNCKSIHHWNHHEVKTPKAFSWTKILTVNTQIQWNGSLQCPNSKALLATLLAVGKAAVKGINKGSYTPASFHGPSKIIQKKRKYFPCLWEQILRFEWIFKNPIFLPTALSQPVSSITFQQDAWIYMHFRKLPKHWICKISKIQI